jgi:hypothetical protein
VTSTGDIRIQANGNAERFVKLSALVELVEGDRKNPPRKSKIKIENDRASLEA